MSAEIEYLILEHLKAIRGNQAAMQADLRDIKTRLLVMLSPVEVRLDLAE